MSKLHIHFLTLFPEMFTGVLSSSILQRAQQNDLVEFRMTNFRDFADDKHSRVDDYPYGGGGGMVLKPEPLFRAVEHITRDMDEQPRILLMSPQGEPYSQQKAEQLAEAKQLIFICGHYEGYDERIREHLATDELSIGDYVLTGGELPAMVIADSIVRLQEGALGNTQSSQTDSFSTGLLEYPHYTRPASYRGMDVPDVLLSGHHGRVEKWRRQQSIWRTWLRRPDLLEEHPLTAEEKAWLEDMKTGRAEERHDRKHPLNDVKEESEND